MDKRAVVLAGGGARGSYQVGVWQALRELQIDYQIVTGTSVGALNGGMMVQQDFAEAQELWENMETKHVLVGNITGNTDNLDGRRQLAASYLREVLVQKGINTKPLEQIIHQIIQEERFRRSKIDFGLVTVGYPGLRALELAKKDIPYGKIADYLIASSAVFPAFRPKEIDGSFYIDGGYHDNLPVNLAVRLGATEIIAVDLAGPGLVPKQKRPSVPLRYIRSYWNLGPLLVFDPEKAKYNIRLGYLDTLKSFGVLEGMAYSFVRGEIQLNSAAFNKAAEQVLFLLFPEFAGKGRFFDSLTRRKLIGTLKERRSESLNFGSAILAAAELAGEILGLSPLVVYSFADFNRLLLEKIAQYEQPLPWENLPEGTAVSNVKEVIGKLSELSRETVLSYLVRYICLAVSSNNLLPLQTVATLLPKEFLAATYLCYLQKSVVNEGE